MDFLERFNLSNLSSVSLTEGLKDRPEFQRDKRDIIKRVCTMFKKMKTDGVHATSLYQPGGEWENYIKERKSFYDALLEEDFDQVEKGLANFWRNNLSPIVKEYAKFEQLVNDEPGYRDRFVRKVAKNYLIWKEVVQMDPAELRVPQIGNHWGLQIEEELVVPKATRYHTHACQIASMISNLDKPVVAEIGGGYCGMAYYLMRDSDHLAYINFDLPETLVIGVYYTLMAFPEKNILLYGELTDKENLDLQKYKAVFLPNFKLVDFPSQSVDVFYNSFSLSEMPKETSTEYLKQVSRICKKYFLHNNMDRKGVVNRGHLRTPASELSIDKMAFKKIYTHFDLFHGHDGDYKEFLYERIH